MTPFLREHIDIGYSDLAADTSPSGYRVYTTPDGRKMPSITTVLSDSKNDVIEAWRKRVGDAEADRVLAFASWRGREVHNALECYVDGIPEDKISMLDNMIIRLGYEKIKKILGARLTTVHTQEVALYSDHFGIAGRSDLIGIFDGRRSVIDYKNAITSKPKDWLDNHFMQSTFYSIAWEERTGVPIDQIVVIIAADDHNEAKVYVEKRDDWAPKLDAYITEWKKENGYANA